MLSALISYLIQVVTLLPGVERDLRLLSVVVRRHDTVVDVGAALGVYSIPMALLVGRGGTVHAFEPRTSAWRRLRRLASLLTLRHLHVHPVAVGATSGTASIVVPGRRRAVPGRSYLSVGVVDARHEDGLVDLEHHHASVVTIDEFRSSAIATRIGFIKCDVEGAELSVFRGAETTLAVDRPVVLCEVEDRHAKRYGNSTIEVAEFFEARGYARIGLLRKNVSDERNQLWVPRERVDELLRVVNAGSRT